MRKMRMFLVAVATVVVLCVLTIGAVALTSDDLVLEPVRLIGPGDPGGGQGGG